MRKLPISYIQPGMILGRDLYANDNSLLLSGGRVLSGREIECITNFKYQAIYIVDDLISNLDIPDELEDIDNAVRHQAVSTAKELFFLINEKQPLNRQAVDNAKQAVNDIVEEVVANQRFTYSMTDLKLFDDYTYYHSVNVTVISVILGVALGLSKNNLLKLGLGGLLHDIGKIFVPKEILLKEEQLSDEEFKIIKGHSKNGYDYLKATRDFPDESNSAVLTHHENFNGSGYPYGLQGVDIPLFGRIIMVADVFDALVSDRPYRKAMIPSEAVEYIIGNSGELFDPQIVNVFMGKITPYPIGTHVVLSNGQTAVVVENRPNFGLRPKVKVIDDAHDSIYYDLSREFFDLTILGVTYS